jgi:hypothetical protein
MLGDVLSLPLRQDACRLPREAQSYIDQMSRSPAIDGLLIFIRMPRGVTTYMAPKIDVLERSPELLLVRWVEPGHSHYGEQRWRPARALRSGICALSGRKIVCADAVFKPSGRPAPANAHAMILVAAVADDKPRGDR